MSKKVYIFLADGFEDIEGLTVVDLMRRAGITITTVSIKNTKQITTAHGITMLTDTTFREADFSDADMLVLPGGQPGTTYLGGFEPLTDLVKSFYNNGGKIAAICAAQLSAPRPSPLLLARTDWPTCLAWRMILGSIRTPSKSASGAPI